MTMYEETMQLIQQSGKTPAVLAAETGLGVRWMYRLIAGDYADPGVNKIETINKHLKSEIESSLN